jgi:hypothetical protein
MMADWENREAAILTVLLLLWLAYLGVVGIRLIVLGIAGSISVPFSWRELEIAGGALIVSAIVAFFVYIHD